MTMHITLTLALVPIALGATALPFFPGRHDALAMALSGIARGLGLGSLLLIPIGLAWLLYERGRTSDGLRRGRAGFVLATLGAGSIAVLVAAIFAATFSGATLAVGLLTAWGFLMRRGGRRLLSWARQAHDRSVSIAMALVLLPGAVAGAQLALARPLTSFAWTQTMDRMAPLIADIERYRVANGHYPRSLFSEWMDYRPGVIGVRGYQYEPSGDSYRLAVEVPTFSFGSREFLVYSPEDSHVMASHDADLLLRTAAELAQYRGYFSARALDRPHWKVLTFD